MQDAHKNAIPTINKKVISIGLLGNCLEFYDLGLCGFLAPIMTPLFFPSENAFIAIIASMTIFTTGFVMRPLGALIFGYIGDAMGRKVSLSHTMLLMAVPTLTISLLPTYHQIGMLAPIVFIACRMLQGVCVGGECNTAAIYLLECSDSAKRGFWSGIITASSNLGFLLASIISMILWKFPESIQWSWRMPFLLGAFIGISGFYLRRKQIIESPIFQKRKLSWSNLKTQRKSLISTFCLGFFSGTLCLSLVGFIPSYLNIVAKLPKEYTVWVPNMGLLLFIVLLPLFGALSDKVEMKKVMRLSAALALCLAYPIFNLLSSDSLFLVLMGEFILVVVTALYMGPMHAFTLSLFPPQYRCRGISVAFALGVGILGGSTPLISVFLIQLLDSYQAPVLYIGFSAVAGMISTYMNSSASSLRLEAADATRMLV